MTDLIIGSSDISDKDILVITGSIEFNAYDKLKSEAINVSNKLKSLEVTEDNVKLAKKLLAGLNKNVKAIEDRRIAIKRRILEPYNDFEEQVKEIVGIVKEADKTVRNQIRELEEIEREQKREIIKTMFDDRISHYSFNELVAFNNFFDNRMLNKTYSLNSIENELSTWLTDVDRDINIIKSFKQDKDELLPEYLKTFDLALAIEVVNKRKQEREKVKTVLEEVTEEIEEIRDNKKLYIYIIEDEKDSKIVELLLKENNIKYKKEIR